MQMKIVQLRSKFQNSLSSGFVGGGSVREIAKIWFVAVNRGSLRLTSNPTRLAVVIGTTRR